MVYRYFENLVDPFSESYELSPGATSSLAAYIRWQLRPYRRLLPFMALTGFLKAALECGLVFYAGYLIDLMVETGPEAFWATHWRQLVTMTFVVLFIRPALIALDHLFLDQAVGCNLQEQVRWHSHRRVLSRPWGFFQKEFAGRLTNRIMQMGPALEEGFHSTFQAIWFAVAYLLSAVVVLSESDWRLGLPLLGWLLIYVVYVRAVTRKVLSAAEDWSMARSSVSGRVVDAYANIETVKVFSYAEHEQNIALDGMKNLRSSASRFRRLMTELALGVNTLNGIMIVAVIGPAIALWSRGHVTPGEVAAAAALTIRLNGMTSWILFVTAKLFENLGVIRDGLRSIEGDFEPEVAFGSPPLIVRTGEVEFRNVTYGYGTGRGGLNGLNLRIRGREKVGLVGSSGAGKSTIVRLALRLADPEKGQILIDGQDVRDVGRDSLRQAFAVVSQDTSLLHRSIRDNLTYGCGDRSDDEIVAAAKKAAAHEFIMELVDEAGRRGYEAHVGERGVAISGGQRQRIAIARAILKDAPILILDEATSALDSEVECSVLAGLDELCEGKTVIAIAHRLSTLDKMDRLVVIGNGRVVEEGTHETLLTNPAGGYSRLWRIQSRAS
jgi:ATP-binding cassette subfamily B multidrug efflux pump